MKKFQKEIIKELILTTLLILWGTGKILGFVLIIFISGLYLTSPMLDFITEYLFVEHLKETLSAIFTLWLGLSISVYIWSLR